MAITNPFTITYGSRAIGGSSDTYLLHGPYIIDKSFENIRVVFDVIVVATTFATLQSLSDALETDLRKRDQDLVINLDGSTWTYTSGTDILNVAASLSKSGNKQTDQGYSRAYTCSIQGELPADDTDGLRELEVNVDFESSRQKIVTMRGTYTALSGILAVAQYQADFDAEATTLLSAIDSLAVFELVDENYLRDRKDYTVQFTRQYVELLVNQSIGSLNDTDIRDHRIVFTDLSQHPGDSKENIYRLRRVSGNYDCSIDIDQTTDLQLVFEDKVKDHIKALFETNFSPQVFCVEDRRVSYDESTKRLSVSIQFLYQKAGGDAIVEVSQSLAFREARNIDYTPIHLQDEFAAEADIGWSTLERVASRTAIVLGEETPKRRLGQLAEDGPAGAIVGLEGGPRVSKDGWNTVQNTSQVTQQWIGDPDETQIRVSVLTETVVERFHRQPSARTRAVASISGIR
jgi:hypothetical protein